MYRVNMNEQRPSPLALTYPSVDLIHRRLNRVQLRLRGSHARTHSRLFLHEKKSHQRLWNRIIIACRPPSNSVRKGRRREGDGVQSRANVEHGAVYGSGPFLDSRRSVRIYKLYDKNGMNNYCRIGHAESPGDTTENRPRKM